MEDQRFDEFTRSMMSVASRRGAFKKLAGSLAGGVVALLRLSRGKGAVWWPMLAAMPERIGA